MHPDPSLADCSAKELNAEEWDYLTSLGFVTRGEPPLQEENVEHFQQLLAGFPEQVEERHSAVWWLAKENPADIAKGFQVRPLDSRSKLKAESRCPRVCLSKNPKESFKACLGPSTTSPESVVRRTFQPGNGAAIWPS